MSGSHVLRSWTSPDGLELAIRDYAPQGGARTPVVCLHGLSRNARDFEDLAPRLAASGRRVLAPDIRGRGRSAWDRDPANYTPAVYAGDVAGLMGALGVERAVFVGTSMGGLIAMILAAIRPELVAGAVLNDVGPAWRPQGLARILGGLGPEPAQPGWREAAARARASQAHAFPDYREADWERMARRLYSQGPDGALARDYDPAILAPSAQAGAPAPDLWPLFSALAAGRPLLLLRGELSELVDQDIADAMQRVAPHMRCVTVPRVGHAPMLDEPAALEALEAFLQAID